MRLKQNLPSLMPMSNRRTRVGVLPLVVVGVVFIISGVFFVAFRDGDKGEPRASGRTALPAEPLPQQEVVPVRGDGDEEEALYFVVSAQDAAVERDGTGASASTPTSTTAYQVVPGDILGAIARKFGCSVAEIKAANGLRSDAIFAGQTLHIPACGGGANTRPATTTAAPRAAAPTAARGAWWRTRGVDTQTLGRLMKEHGFKPPQRFKAMVIEITFDATRTVVTRERAFDWNGTSSDRDGWNPASTVKLYAAIAALQRTRSLGFSARAAVTFHGKKDFKTTVTQLVEDAIIKSDNLAYNRLVQLASFEALHGRFLVPSNGIHNSALMRAYHASAWTALGESASLRSAPPITLQEGKRSVKLEAENSKRAVECSAAACATLQDLAEASRRLMLQEQLPASESFDLERGDLLVLRRAMRAERSRGNEMVDAFAEVFNDERVRFYSKPGFSEDWFADNVYIFDPRVNQAWIVTMAGYPGRKSLDSAAKSIAKVIASGALRKAGN